MPVRAGSARHGTAASRLRANPAGASTSTQSPLRLSKRWRCTRRVSSRRRKSSSAGSPRRSARQGSRTVSCALSEVWQVVPFDESGTKHREERLYFLRIQVLREVATGVKQRLGLEPWGRLKVSYRGVTAELPFVTKWAPLLRVSKVALTEGIAALLDHLRRLRVLHDESTKLFETMWNSGDKEVQYGYLPTFPGGPKGAKLRRGAADLPARVSQWVGSRPTQVWNAVAAWGVPEHDLETFLEELWASLCEQKVLVPVTLSGWGKPLKGSAGTVSDRQQHARPPPAFGSLSLRQVSAHHHPAGTDRVMHGLALRRTPGVGERGARRLRSAHARRRLRDVARGGALGAGSARQARAHREPVQGRR